MTVTVLRNWRGGESTVFELQIPDGKGNPPWREFVTGDEWTRETATDALDLIEHVYGYPRRLIRFRHV